jgi:hypothetical protein
MARHVGWSHLRARDQDAQRLQLTGFGPRERRASKRIRHWAEVRSSAELAAAARGAAPESCWWQHGSASSRDERRRGVALSTTTLPPCFMKC